LKELKNLKKLELLEIEGTQVTGAGKSEIKEALPGLKFGLWDGLVAKVQPGVPMFQQQEEPQDWLGWLFSRHVIVPLLIVLGAGGILGRRSKG
jgi:hypothetical protein